MKQSKKASRNRRVQTLLKKGDPVIVVAGGNSKTRVLKGKTSKVVGFTGKARDRVVLDGLNVFTRHRRQTQPNKPHGKLPIEQSVHVSNVRYYAEKIKKGVRLCYHELKDGQRVRGYYHGKNREFVQLESHK